MNISKTEANAIKSYVAYNREDIYSRMLTYKGMEDRGEIERGYAENIQKMLWILEGLVERIEIEQM